MGRRYDVVRVDLRESNNPLVRELVAEGSLLSFVYRTVDTLTGRTVPFGQHRSRERAEQHAKRMERRA